MAYSTEIRAAIEQYLKNDEWNYTFDEEREVIRCGINLRNRLKECRIIVDIDETKCLSLGLISLNCDEEHRVELSKFLTMVNYGLLLGNFEMDFNDGEVRYKIATNCKDCIPSQAVIEDSMMIPAIMFEQFGDAMIDVMFGYKTAEEAYASTESNE